MAVHLKRWIAQLGNVVTIMAIRIDQNPNRAAILDFAERLEEIAKNIRERAPEA